METERITLFNEKQVTLKRMFLIDCNRIMVPVANSVTRLMMGEADLFSHWSVKDFAALQEIMCKYVNWVETGKNLNFIEISENLGDFLGLQFEFLEFNFKLFSQSQKIMKRINGQLLETKEIPDQQN